MPCLMLLNTQNIPAKEWVLGDESLSVGRSEHADVQVGDPRLSRLHFQIRQEGERYILDDLGSVAGTLLNGEPLSGKTLLKPGDLIQAGDSRFFFDVGTDTVININTEAPHNETMVGAYIQKLRNKT